MEFEGLISGYPVNRPLTQQELNDHLPIDRRIDIEPHQQLATIIAVFAWKAIAA